MSAAVSREKDDEGNGLYKISASLVHLAISSIIAGMLSIAGYMVVWALNDTGWKSRQEQRLVAAEKDIDTLESTVKEGVLPVAKQRLLDIERRLDRLEKR